MTQSYRPPQSPQQPVPPYPGYSQAPPPGSQYYPPPPPQHGGRYYGSPPPPQQGPPPYGVYGPPPQAQATPPYGVYYGPPGRYGQPPQQAPAYPAYGQPQQYGAYYGQPQQQGATKVVYVQGSPVNAEHQVIFTFTDDSIRKAFIRKVYLLLFLQLLVTCGMISLFLFVEPIKRWVQGDGAWFYLLAFVVFFALYIALICCPSVRRKEPGNYICLALFTLTFSYMTATISSFHDTTIVLVAAGITAILCLSITLFALQTSIDFTLCTGFLLVFCVVFLLFSVACIIVFLVAGFNYIMAIIYGTLGALLFGMFLVYDTQRLMGDRAYELSPDEYIFGAVTLYIDIVQIFLYILCLSEVASR